MLVIKLRFNALKGYDFMVHTRAIMSATECKHYRSQAWFILG